MKILYYNWVQFDNPSRQGGGVNVYQYNLIEALKDDPSVDVWFLSSGQKVNPFRRGAYFVKTTNCFGDRCRSYEIINSPILASGLVHINPRSYLEDIRSEEIFAKFLAAHGPFDIIHFQNIEGLSSNVFRLKSRYPRTKFVFSVHNYFSVCTTGNLFHLRDRMRCTDCRGGNKCVTCDFPYGASMFYADAILHFLFRDVQDGLFRRCFHRMMRFLAPFVDRRLGGVGTMIPSNYVSLRKHNVDLINRYVDVALAVSERVRQIMIEYGVLPEKIVTSYIGTKVADRQLGRSIASRGDLFTIAYLGYARADKGFFFLMDALAKFEPALKSKLRLVLAVKNLDREQIMRQLIGFGEVRFHDGYTHADLPTLLGDVNLGIIPVIWEDNLPQIAIEMVANGVPILCSSFGGGFGIVF